MALHFATCDVAFLSVRVEICNVAFCNIWCAINGLSHDFGWFHCVKTVIADKKLKKIPEKKKKKLVQMHYQCITMCYDAVATNCTPVSRTFTLNVLLDTFP